MSGQFLIAGLPRCRTAWLSVVASTPRSICHHEPTSYTQSFDEMLALWKPRLGVAVGISDSALSLHLEPILEVVRPKTLLVVRPVNDVVVSMRKYLAGLPINEMAGISYLRRLEAEAVKFRCHPLVKTVQFKELRDYDLVRDLLGWLVPDAEFPDLRSLMTMNIQVDRDHMLKLFRQPHTHWYCEKCSISPRSATA